MNPIIGGFALLFIMSKCHGLSNNTPLIPDEKKHVLGELRVGDCFRRFEPANEFEPEKPDEYGAMIKKKGVKEMLVAFFAFGERHSVDVVWPIDLYERSELHWKVNCKTGAKL